MVTGEGVDEGSAASSTEGSARVAGDVLGPATSGDPDTEESPAGPDLVETPESRRAHDGQQLAEGEG